MYPLLIGQLFDDSNRFVLEPDSAADSESETEHSLIPPPSFVVGCRRSRTTLVGRLLSLHASLLFLYELRALWLSVFPEIDVGVCAKRQNTSTGIVFDYITHNDAHSPQPRTACKSDKQNLCGQGLNTNNLDVAELDHRHPD